MYAIKQAFIACSTAQAPHPIVVTFFNPAGAICIKIDISNRIFTCSPKHLPIEVRVEDVQANLSKGIFPDKDDEQVVPKALESIYIKLYVHILIV